MEEKRKGVQHFSKFSAGRHKREATPDTPTQAVEGRKGRGKWVKPLVILLIIGAVAAAAMTFRGMKAGAAIAQVQSHNTASAERRSISSELSSSETLKARDTYSVTSMVEGEVLSAGSKEGDQVERDQVPYEIDKSSMEPQLTSSMNSLSRSQSFYEDTLEGYNDALDDYSGNTYKATDTGYIKELYISAGDRVNENTKLADVYSGDVMEIGVPSLSRETAMIGAGMPAVVTLADTGEQVTRIVKAVVNQETIFTGGRLAYVVTIQVQSPNSPITSLRATAQIGESIGSEDGTSEISVDTIMNAGPSTSVEVESLLVNVGDYVTKRTPVSKMADKSVGKLIQGYKGTLDKAEESAELVQNKLDSAQDSYNSHTIKAPISDQVITKNLKVGDNTTKNSSNIIVLATIYDLSSPTFEMSIDEPDIRKVKVGQKVKVSTDAFEGQAFSGTATNISLESAYSNGVSTYLATVALGDMGDLLPGMNVDRVITLEEANDVLAIPVDVPTRGDQVYVKDGTVTERQGPVLAGFRSVKAETGLASDTYVEIINGLSEGDVVYVAGSSKNSSNFIMMMDGGMGGPPGRGGNMGGQSRGGPGDRQNR